MINQQRAIAFTIRPGCENAIDTGDADVYVVPDQPMTVRAWYDNKELAQWLVQYNVGAETARMPKVETSDTNTDSKVIDAVVEVIAEGDISG